jgi:hypothetical protein
MSPPILENEIGNVIQKIDLKSFITEVLRYNYNNLDSSPILMIELQHL